MESAIAAIKDNAQVQDAGRALKQAFQRSAGFYAVGAFGGVLLALSRSANVTHYALHVGTNCFLVAFACFLPREAFYRLPSSQPTSGISISDSVASTASGALGGFAAMRFFSGTTRQGVKGALAFGACGFVMEKADAHFEQWKLAKRDEIVQEQKREWTPSAWQERQAGIGQPNPFAAATTPAAGSERK